MYEKEVEKAQERLNAALTLAGKQPIEAINMIEDMEKWVDENIDNSSIEYLGIVITYNEVIGDLYLKMNKFVEAEKHYKKMITYAQKLYEMDHEKYDLRLAVAYCKLANNCAVNIGLHVILQNPRVLTEKTQVPYDAGTSFYKMAIKILDGNCKKGSGKHLEIRAKAINSLAIMEASVGHYKESIAMLTDAVNILKAIYQTVDNKNAGNILAQTLINKASVCTLYKKPAEAQECMEDSIYVLKEHEDEDTVRAGVMIARNYMNLAGCLLMQGAPREEVDEVYDKATSKVSMVNAVAKDSVLSDEMTCYMLAGQYYKATEREEKGMQLLNHALDIVNGLLEKDPERIPLINSKKHIEMIINGGKAEN